ncbi:radical SAM family heme chaperone HemW [Aminipila luticellarii]|uniref:Heme chaperone HemW n=1 Tax=Aminipila luticellarii TaxID=2507160 RepID=A0A410PUK8_9FIRM|nr:radical SAM family heme chaperone HemW [Aminipila luticellarii]QAT42651.1 oxygen-independent coproporphyrinogen III oxidase [Aminipila luticellarii]
MKNLGIYIHIPFCIKKCLYCDFLSFENTAGGLHREYVNAVMRELDFYSNIYDNKFIVDSIFFGGGTPSLIDARLMKEILLWIKQKYQVDKKAEITIECNPKTIDAEKLRIYKEAGINRISIGVQTLNDMELISLGRVHRSEDAKETYALARQAGFDNINMDLMFAIPSHTCAVWQETLKQAVCLNPEHISFYSLQLEEKTKYFEMFEKGELELVSDDVDREMYHFASKFLKKSGYHHYEISNCAKPGFECRHNLKYWSMADYLGIGLGAHSYVNGERFSNVRDLAKYIGILGSGDVTIPAKEEKARPKWVEWRHINAEWDDIVDFIITGMRREEGIGLREFERRFGKKLFEVYPEQEGLIREYVEKGMLLLDENRMRFTIKGVDVSNTILAEFV